MSQPANILTQAVIESTRLDHSLLLVLCYLSVRDILALSQVSLGPRPSLIISSDDYSYTQLSDF